MGAAIALVVIPLTVAQFCIGSAMFSGIAMAMLIGGSHWSPQVAGWGGSIGGALFGVILMLMSVGLLLQIETVVDADLPTLALINEIHPVLGWLGILFVVVLSGAWLLNGRNAIGEEIRRRDRIRALILRRLNPKRSWTAKHATVLEQQVVDSNLEAEELGEFVGSEVYVELEETTGMEIPVEVQEQLGQ